MSKKDGGKKAKKAKLPKEVLGIRLSKEVREIGGALLEKANSSQGREMLAAGLTMAAGLASAAAAKKQAARQDVDTPPRAPAAPHAPDAPSAPPNPSARHDPSASPQGAQRQPDPQVVAEAVGKAAEAMLGRFFGVKKA